MALPPRQLLRFYPSLWRLRYGAEFLALLESTPITRAVVRDVIRAAAHEWLFHTRVGMLAIGVTSGSASALCGVMLAKIVAPGWLAFDQISESAWMMNAAVVLALFPMIAGALIVRAAASRTIRLRFRTQLLALSLASTLTQWLHVVALNPEIGSQHVLEICFQGAFYVSFWMILTYNLERSRELDQFRMRSTGLGQ